MLAVYLERWATQHDCHVYKNEWRSRQSRFRKTKEEEARGVMQERRKGGGSSGDGESGHILGLFGRQSQQALLLDWMWGVRREGQVMTSRYLS